MISEILEIQKKIYDNSSAKEKTFFSFLNGSPVNYEEVDSLTEADELVLQAFSKNSKFETTLAVKYLRTKPVKNIHFSNNLIELCAVAYLKFDETKEYLQKYYENSGSRDRWIINQIFPDICFEKKSIDRFNELIDLADNHEISNSIVLIMNHLASAEDLLDLFLIKDIYIRSIQKNINYLLFTHKRILNISNKISNQIVNAIFIITFTIISVSIIRILPSNWDAAEAYITVIGYITGFIAILITIIFHKKIDQIKIIQYSKLKLTKMVLRLIYLPYGINPNKILSIIEQNKISYES